MADIFLSYASEDDNRAKALSDLLSASGWRVLTPRKPGWLLGKSQPEVRNLLASSDCVAVLWSSWSITSARVLAHAEIAQRDRKLVQVLLSDVVKPPPEFQQLESRVFPWSGEADNKQLEPLIDLLASVARVRLTPPVVQAKAAARSPEIGVATSPQPQLGSHDAPSEPTRQIPNATIPQVGLPRTKIFLCYRRDDSQDATGRLHDKLVEKYGSERLFMDIDTVPIGVDFVDHIHEQMESCAVVVVMIGRSWLTATDHRGRRRLDQEDDLVRAEIAEALNRKLPLIPVLIQNAAIPRADELSEDIRLLARRNAIELSHQRWKEDVQRLLKALERFVPSVERGKG